MQKFLVELESGTLGTTVLECADIQTAKNMAREWAIDGVWRIDDSIVCGITKVKKLPPTSKEFHAHVDGVKYAILANTVWLSVDVKKNI